MPYRMKVKKPVEKPTAKKLLDNLTFGFEIEGYFSKDLDELQNINNYGDFRSDFHVDGSVHIDSDEVISAIGGDILCGSESREDCDSCEGNGYYNANCDCIEEGNYSIICDNKDPEHQHQVMQWLVDKIIPSCFATACEDDVEIHEMRCDDCDARGYFGDEDEDGEWYSEFSSPIFGDLESCKNMLGEFKAGTHIFNESCGLHLHIGAKSEDYTNALWQLASNFDLLEQIHADALSGEYCKCQKERTEYQMQTNRTRFAEKYNEPLQLVAETKNGEKYRFVRFHKQYQTLEFRFLTPCKHKVKNVQRLVDTIIKFAQGKQEHHATCDVDDSVIGNEVMEISIKLPTEADKKAHAENLELARKELNNMISELTGRSPSRLNFSTLLDAQINTIYRLNLESLALYYPEIWLTEVQGDVKRILSELQNPQNRAVVRSRPSQRRGEFTILGLNKEDYPVTGYGIHHWDVAV